MLLKYWGSSFTYTLLTGGHINLACVERILPSGDIYVYIYVGSVSVDLFWLYCTISGIVNGLL